MDRRRALALFALPWIGFVASGCGGASSTLHTLGEPSGSGDIRFDVDNRSGAIVNNLYLAPTAKVRAAPRTAFHSGDPAQAALWGEDRLPSGLAVGERVRVAIPSPGRYDIRAVDRDGNEQHVAGLKLAAGGRYVLELHSGSWHPAR